ncbi:SDR family NAD(P)-dependent oxidoreductase [Bradyrhizobium jicamae]|uniref:SDR family NAD(P)-dependent oxidoreductase n=1 Tax=Bradyrhizobium jicamae TaxID=280332 RepID=UPI001BA7D77F|nr:SDR family NAD(P)-dependent oxidoreductase [Bradyrhizobium jicamae]MBR0757469.1 SDR family NAD(P)-dependent oxidoreductase [Bradyrhizobium jicamae]
MSDQAGKAVLVTGASRGLGRGVARQFGRLGATVYVTSRASSAVLLAETAAEVTAGGGKGVAVPMDQHDPTAVEALFRRIREETGKLDILVNNAAAVAPELARPGAFWEKPLAVGDIIEVGLHTNYMAAYFAAPLMVECRQGLIANISFYGAVTYFHGPAYGAAKAGTDKMSFDMALELRAHDVACISLWPGFVYSDELAKFAETLPKDRLPPTLAAALPQFERPEFTALVLNALHDDPKLMELSGQALIGAELGQRYGLRDIDGKQPAAYRETMGAPLTFLPPDPKRPMGA